jgi:hypothetical protein
MLDYCAATFWKVGMRVNALAAKAEVLVRRNARQPVVVFSMTVE